MRKADKKEQSGESKLTKDASGVFAEQSMNTDDTPKDLFDYFILIFKYRRMVVWFCAIAVVVTAMISLLSPKTYSATTSVVPPIDMLQKQSNLESGLGVGKGSLISKAVGMVNIADIYVGILQSRVIADNLINRFDLMKVYGESQSRAAARAKLQKNTTINVSNEGIVTVTVQDANADRAADIANAYVEELDRQNKKLSLGQATSKRVFLESRLKEIEGKLSKIDNILSREAKMQEMLFELLTREYEIAKIEEVKSMPTIQILDRAVVPETRTPRGTKGKVLLAAAISFVLAFFVAILRESLRARGISQNCRGC